MEHIRSPPTHPADSPIPSLHHVYSTANRTTGTMTLGHVDESRAPIPLIRARARTAVPHTAVARATRAPALG
eukprot:3589926-Pleurochrysis_carterae.AAC.1